MSVDSTLPFQSTLASPDESAGVSLWHSSSFVENDAESSTAETLLANAQTGSYALTTEVAPTPYPSGPHARSVPRATWFLVPFWSITVLIILYLLFPEILKIIKTGEVTLKSFQKIPCKHCRFFSKSIYLQCAVRPADALTKRAICCTDFMPKETKEPVKESDVPDY
ncbi:MAG: hypothetical protein MUF49_31015 [Oculatellaceae cyanobacterium Prado106]|jgi:hypothetical protein|nr:hypothetical protein [Oculatellaceae cyanobacterium Prado106]